MLMTASKYDRARVVSKCRIGSAERAITDRARVQRATGDADHLSIVQSACQRGSRRKIPPEVAWTAYGRPSGPTAILAASPSKFTHWDAAGVGPKSMLPN